MGRYYYFTSGNEGKFGFAVQPSDDPETVFGMTPATIDYQLPADKDSRARVEKIVAKQYDILGVPEGERAYSFATVEDRLTYTARVWADHAVAIVHRDKFEGRGCPYALTAEQEDELRGEGKNPNDYVGQPKGDDIMLAYYRATLGLDILAEMDIEGENGYVSMNAEM